MARRSAVFVPVFAVRAVIVVVTLRKRGHDQLSVLDPLGRKDAIGRSLDRCRGPAQHDDFEAVVVIEVHVQCRDDLLSKLVLHRSELFGEFANVVVVHERKRRCSKTATGNVRRGELGTNEVSQRLGSRCVSATSDVFIEASE